MRPGKRPSAPSVMKGRNSDDRETLIEKKQREQRKIREDQTILPY
jgi:hypothetical protein